MMIFLDFHESELIKLIKYDDCMANYLYVVNYMWII